MTTYPTTDCEPPNPYASPQEVATGDVVQDRREVGQLVIDLRHQTIGFALLTGTGLIGLLLAGTASWFMAGPAWTGLWGWLQLLLGYLSIPLAMICVPLAAICGPWTLLSAAQWRIASSANRRFQEQRP